MREENSNETVIPSRTKRNQSLYQSMSNADIDNFDVNSNTKVLDNNKSTIDVEKLKDMLDKQYHAPQRTSSVENLEQLEEYKLKLQETREYDVNKILDEAHDSKEVDYEVERFKKLRNTNLDILNELNIEKENEVAKDDEPTSVSRQESKKLKELIDTINLKEQEGYEKIEKEETHFDDPLELLEDLKGKNDDTRILGAKELEEITKEAPAIPGIDTNLENTETNELIEITKEIEKSQEIEKTKDLEKTNTQSLTASNMFTQSDFDDFNDLKEEVASTRIIIKLLIFLIIMVLVAGAIFIVNKYLNLGLF